jgi:hypothetical protein
MKEALMPGAGLLSDYWIVLKTPGSSGKNRLIFSSPGGPYVYVQSFGPASGPLDSLALKVQICSRPGLARSWALPDNLYLRSPKGIQFFRLARLVGKVRHDLPVGFIAAALPGGHYHDRGHL